MSTHRQNYPVRHDIHERELYDRMFAYGLGRARLLRAVAVRRAGQTALRLAATLPGRCGRMLWRWQNRYNARQHMAALDARLLDDVGLTRADIARVARTPFWRP